MNPIELMKLSRAAQFLGVHRKTIDYYISTDNLQCYTLEGSNLRYVARQDLERIQIARDEARKPGRPKRAAPRIETWEPVAPQEIPAKSTVPEFRSVAVGHTIEFLGRRFTNLGGGSIDVADIEGQNPTWEPMFSLCNDETIMITNADY